MAQYREELAIKSASSDVKTDVFLSVGFVYDAIWTIALALNFSIQILAERGLGRLEDFTYNSVEMADVLTEVVTNVSFKGISVSDGIIIAKYPVCTVTIGRCVI